MTHDSFDFNSPEREILLNTLKEFTEILYRHIEGSKGYTSQDNLTQYDENLLNPRDKDSYNNLLNFIDSHLNKSGINAASGRHLGYIPGGGMLESAIGNYIASLGNYYSGVSYAAPIAVDIENHLIQWTGEVMGYEPGFLGNITSGGSLAHLTALHTAKNARKINSTNIRNQCIYFSSETHNSIHKALKITALEECHIRVIPVDDNYCVDTQVLESRILSDIKAGLTPFMIVSNAGSTNSGAVDDLSSISKFSHKHNIWHHVDAAYGGFFNLTHRGKVVLNGIQESDSMILDPHKGLFQSYGLGIVLIKNGKLLQKAFTEHADYMRDAETIESLSPANLSIELTRPFRGLGMWMALKIHGIGKFSEALNQKLDLADMFFNRIKTMGFETGPNPQLSVVLFRLENDEDNTRLIQDIHFNCSVFIFSTNYGDKLWLRIAVLSHRTRREHVEELLDYLNGWTQNHPASV